MTVLQVCPCLFCAMLPFVAAAVRGEEGNYVRRLGEESEHDHLWEYAAIFEAHAEESPSLFATLTATKVDGAYAESSMKIAVFEVDLVSVENGVRSSQDLVNEAEELAEHIFEAGTPCVNINATDDMPIVPSNETCYNLLFDDESHISLFKIVSPVDLAATSSALSSEDHDHETGLALFMEHNPSEFEQEDIHFLKSSDGTDILPAIYIEGSDEASSESSSRKSDVLRNTMQTCAIVLATTLVGIAFLGPVTKFSVHSSVLIAFCSAFGSGVLLGSAVFLIWAESLHLIAEKYNDEESSSVWRWGTMILSGFIMNVVIDYFVAHTVDAFAEDALPVVPSKHAVDEGKQGVTIKNPHTDISTDEEATDSEALAVVAMGDNIRSLVGNSPDNAKTPVKKETASAWHSFKSLMFTPQFQSSTSVDTESTRSSDSAPSTKTANSGPAVRRISLISSICVGDFFHNFSDGIFLGAAFQTCNQTFAWTLTLSVVAHELSQELSDFFLLTTLGGLSPALALLVNFLSGLSVMIGGAIVAYGNVDDSSVGLILAFGGGTYMYLAATISMPLVIRSFHSTSSRADYEGIANCESEVRSSGSDNASLAGAGSAVAAVTGTGAGDDARFASSKARVKKRVEFRDRMQHLVSFALFVLGAAAIGLVLLDHEHCGSDEGVGGASGVDSGGHSHRQ